MANLKTPSWHGSRRRMAIGLLAVGALALVGCETARDPEVLRNPNYSSGYSDGCQTAQNRVTGFDDSVTRNRALAEIEPVYDMGWRDGYAACGSGDYDGNDSSTREIFRRGSEHYETAPH